MNTPRPPDDLSEGYNIEQVELKGFSRSVAELEWLLLILMLLYFIAPGTYVENEQAVVLGMVCFAVFVFVFRYLNFNTQESRWKIAIETWAMIAFISWMLWFTGKDDSPLLNLYLLVIITSGLTLGKTITLLEFALITCIYLYLGYPDIQAREFNLMDFTELMIRFTPFLLIAYLITMLSADLHFARRMFQYLSETDELTGLFNKRAFTKMMAREIVKSVRYSHPFAVLMIDADSLKHINDEYGHDTGDKLIRTVSETIRVSLRDSDILARYGGDEFVAFLPETTALQANEVAERIRQAATATRFSVQGRQIPVTVSIGLASYPDDANSPEDVQDRADRALYYSKQGGRNRVTVFSDIPLQTVS